MAAHWFIHAALHIPHLVAKYLNARKKGKSRKIALRETAHEAIVTTISIPAIIARTLLGALCGLLAGLVPVALCWWVFSPTSMGGIAVAVIGTMCLLIITTIVGATISFVKKVKKGVPRK